MVESATAPKKHLALDTDWMSAVVALCAFFIFGLVGAASVWAMMRGKIGLESVTWWTQPLLAAGCIYGAIVLPDKRVRIAFLIFAIGPVSRMILWLGRASAQTRLTNEIFVRCIDIGLCFAICIYAVHWLRTKVRHV